jgi:hypothetical protein
MTVKDISNVDELLDRIDRIDNAKLSVGILGDADSEILLRANVNEFGSPTRNIPERSFIRGAIDKYGKDIGDFSENLIIRYIDGKITFDACMNTIGEYVVGKIQRYMVDLRTPPNAESTIEQKGSSNPLIDTGQLLDSVSYKVVE